MARAVTPIRLIALGCAGIGAFYAAAQLSGSKSPADDAADAVVAPAMRAAPRPGAPASAAANAASAAARAAGLARPDRSAAIPSSTGDPFATLSWLPPPPPPPLVVVARPAPPAAPVAPPLPFAFVGMVEQGKTKPQAFLSKGDALLIVSAGETIDDGAYRVESMNATQIVMTHVPTNTQQTINVSGSSK